MAFSSNNDVNILSSADAAIVGAGAGDDTYIISPGTLPASTQTITISDTLGANKVQLIGGLTIASSIVAANAIQLTLSNGAIININGANTFTFEIGGDPLLGTPGTVQTFEEFVTVSLGVVTVPTGTSIAQGAADVDVNADGTTTIPGAATYALAAGAAAVNEGANATFTLTTTGVAEGTAVAYTLSGIDAADLASGALTGQAVVGADGKATINVALAADTKTEGAETLTVSLDGKDVSANATVNDTSKSFELTASAANDNREGKVQTFTVTAPSAVAVDTVVTFKILVGDATAANQGTEETNMNDFAQGSFNPVSVVIPAGQTTATFSVSGANNDSLTELPEAYTVQAVVAGQTLTLEASLLDGAGTYVLNSALGEHINGTEGDDVFIASDTTLALDVLDGKGGNDTLEYSDFSGSQALEKGSPTLTSIETINMRATDDGTGSGGEALADVSAYTDVKTVNVLVSQAATITAADTTDVNVLGATNDVTVSGANNVLVNTKNGQDITVDGSAGSVTVNATKQQAGVIDVDGGTDITITSTLVDANGGNILVGDVTAPTGDVVITQTITSKAEGDFTGSDITVVGGSTVTVDVTATSTATKTTSDGALTVGAVDVTGDGTTTSVAVTQDLTATEFTKAGTALVGATQTITFAALAAGKSVTVGYTDIVPDPDVPHELTFTASKDLTAAEVAAAFANLINADSQSVGGPTKNGVYSTDGSRFIDGWTSAAANGASVTFTSALVNPQPLTPTSNAVVGPVVGDVVVGTAAVAAVWSGNTVEYGTVTITDDAAAAITTAAVDGFSAVDVVDTTKLATLNLANSDAALVDVDSAAVLALALDNVDGAVTLNDATTLNITTSGSASNVAIAAETVLQAGLTALTVAGDANLNLTGSALADLKTVKVSGSVSLVLDGTDDTLTSVDASASTGGVTASVDGDVEVLGGSGADDITASLNLDGEIAENINLGDGDDTLDLTDVSGDFTEIVGEVTGGAGTDTLVLTAVAADLASDSINFDLAVTGFERLTVIDSDLDIVDLAKLTYDYVTVDGGLDVLTLTNMVNGGTVALNNGADAVVGIKDAATGSSDTLKVVLSSDDGGDWSDLTANDVEAISITATDAAALGTDGHGLTLTAEDVTQLTISGAAHLDLLAEASTVLTKVDATAQTGGLIFNTTKTGQTVLGGAGADHFTASDSQAVLNGGAGNDTLVISGVGTINSVQLTGGAGADMFIVAAAADNLNAVSTIKDLGAGDTIVFVGAHDFQETKVVLDAEGNPNLTDYANAAIAEATDLGGMAWFQYNNNTYIVQDRAGGTAYQEGTDCIIKITGLVDLGAASFNSTISTLEIA